MERDAYADDAPRFIETSFCAKFTNHLKRNLNQAKLETAANEALVQHPERELELNGLAAPDITSFAAPDIATKTSHHQTKQETPTGFKETNSSMKSLSQARTLMNIATKFFRKSPLTRQEKCFSPQLNFTSLSIDALHVSRGFDKFLSVSEFYRIKSICPENIINEVITRHISVKWISVTQRNLVKLVKTIYAWTVQLCYRA